MSAAQLQIIEIFIMIAVGFICGKTKLIDADGCKKLSKLCLWLVNPVLIFMSYQRDYSADISKNLAVMLAVSAALFAVSIGAAALFVPKRRTEYAIERMSLIFTNCSFVGIPLVQSVCGDGGVIYLTVYITVFNIIAWTYGLGLMSGERLSFRGTLKKLCTPAIISVFLGLIFYFCRIRLPEIVSSPLNAVGSINTPLAMLVAGATLAGTDILKCLRNVRLYVLSALRLIVMPALCCIATFWLARFGVDRDIIRIAVIGASCSSAAIATMFAHTYGKNSAYASEIFAMTTLLSFVSIPAVLKFLSLLFEIAQ